MEALNKKMALGFLIMFSTWTQFVTAKPNPQQQQQQQHSEQRPQTHNHHAQLKSFVDKIKYRISLGEEVAKYKWIEGGAILDQAREKTVLDSVEKMVTELGFSFNPEDRLFFVDLMEATKLIEYVLVSEWYGTVKENPQQSVNLMETRNKISGMQKELIELLYTLKPLQHSDECQSVLGKMIAECRTENNLLRTALQRAFGNYCSKNMAHKRH